ncbi:hypothetical protein NLG97_g4904 [Lecanicillium saksenae]|uniref:Uncharacterized protein n=1 Tax=Lecanicillium saksenae TaxID=468837 RepID=A0ACC1QVU9_9HYPO|nr:hypothetical protein NLG97_g4904 [Lecanicillium saksenae]
MAHKTSTLPWENLTSVWETGFLRLSNTKYTNKPSSIAVKLPKFVPSYENIEEHSPPSSEFAKTLGECAITEAQQLKQRFAHVGKIAKPTDIIISDAVARRITPHLLQFRTFYDDNSALSLREPPPHSYKPVPLCTHNQGLDCGCILPLPYRRLLAFCPSAKTDDDENESSNGPGIRRYFAEIILSVLITENEMQPILSIVTSPYDILRNDYFVRAKRFTFLGPAIYRKVLYGAMCLYIILNALCELRETWDPAAKLLPWHDYRDTNLYQGLISGVKGRLQADSTDNIYQRLHQSFLEMPETWSLMPFKFKRLNLPPVRLKSDDHWTEHRLALGTMPFSSFAGSNKARRSEMEWLNSKFQGGSSAKFLHEKGLPMEIVNIIMALAEMDTWKFIVPDDPLNIGNRPVLLKYLQREDLERAAIIVLSGLPRTCPKI